MRKAVGSIYMNCKMLVDKKEKQGGNIMKKVTKIFAFAVAICMLFSVTTTTAFAEETITNMTYDEWLAEQENNNTACK